MALCNLPVRYPWEREGTGGPHAGCTDDEGKGIKGKVGEDVCDYLSGMTDQYSMAKFRKIFIPKSWEVY